MTLRRCLLEPVPAIEIAAQLLDSAVSAHLAGDKVTAEGLLAQANDNTIREWLNLVWGTYSVHTLPRRKLATPPVLPRELRARPRDATETTKTLIHQRDGFYCRFCAMPVIRSKVRLAIQKEYSIAVPWGNTNASQHAAFQCMWAQYDHVVPHQRGGTSDFGNVYLTCAACNYGRNCALLEELDLEHPDAHARRVGEWDGLERFLNSR